MANLKYELIDSLDEIGAKEWNSVVEDSSVGTFFHGHEWLYAIEKGGEAKAKHMIIRKNDNLVSIFPNFIFKLRGLPFNKLCSVFPSHGGPLILKNEKEIMNIYLKKLPSICNSGIVRHEIYFYNPELIRYCALLRGNGYVPELESAFILDTKTQQNELKKKTRRNITKGEKYGYDLEIDELNNENLNRFYDIYSTVMNTIDGHIWSKDIFKTLIKNAPENVQLLSLYHDDEYISGEFNILDKNNSTYYSFFNGMAKEYLRYGSHYFLTWKTIEHCKENDFRFYDFGSAENNYENGIFKFKNRWGANIIPVVRWEKNYSKMKMGLFELGYSVNKRFQLTKKINSLRK